MDAYTLKARDTRQLATDLQNLEHELDCLAPGPGYYEAKQKLKAQVEDARRAHTRAQQELQQLTRGTQTSLL